MGWTAMRWARMSTSPQGGRLTRNGGTSDLARCTDMVAPRMDAVRGVHRCGARRRDSVHGAAGTVQRRGCRLMQGGAAQHSAHPAQHFVEHVVGM
ncbi:Os07g0652900 [Oryza sativa Japonica Group]|uniref:Os07g0652900 protein n=1 Tax=Oryza sativa subsp. japonica TaxID=39947 RepID=A0A0P0X9U0_ORYSJ|nr:Os07g0652900 [Oryza sativa Japonica Group]